MSTIAVTITPALREAARAAGEAAFHGHKIERDAWHLYERILDYSASRGYCWHEIKTFAMEFLVCVREIGRWVKQLKDAGLIIRKRRAGQSAYTYVSVYCQSESDPIGLQESDTLTERTLNLTTGGEKKEPPKKQVSSESRPEPARPKQPITTYDDIPDTPTVRIFRDLGTKIPACLAEVAHLAVDQARVIAAQVRTKARRDPSTDPGALAVYLARSGFGAPTAEEPPPEPILDERGELWQRLLDQLRVEVPMSDFETWFAPTTLIYLDERGQAAVDCQNIFGRDQIEQYVPLIERLLEQALGRAVAVELAIGS